MADPNDDIRYYADRLDAVLHKFTGGLGTGGSSTSKRRRSSYEEDTGLFSKTIKTATDSLRLLHGSAGDASHALRDVVGFVGVGAALTSLVSGLTDMTRTYSKMTSIGETFGGSMFEMQRAAGESGLTLDQFAESMTKSSMVVARMGSTHAQGIKDFTDYQKEVRKGLADFGFFGMSLADVTNVTSDYAETLRATGQWEKLTTIQRRNATVSFVQNIQGLADATGRSRDELMKETMEAVSAPDIAAVFAEMAANGRQDQATSLTSALASVNATFGKNAEKLVSELIVQKGNYQFSAQAQGLIGAGLGEYVSMFNKYQQDLASGRIKVGSVEDFTEKQRIIDYGSRDKRLTGFMQQVPELKPFADMILEWLKNGRALGSVEKQRADFLLSQNEQMKSSTLSMQLLQTRIDALTGSFRQGFYEGIMKWLYDPKSGNEFQQRLEALSNLVRETGVAFGSMFGMLLNVLPLVVGAFKRVIDVMGFFQSAIEYVLTKIGVNFVANKVSKIFGGGGPVYEQDAFGNDLIDKKTNEKVIKYKRNKDGEFEHDEHGNKIAETREDSNAAKVIASTAVLGIVGMIGLWIKRRISSKLYMRARDVYLSTEGGIHGPNGKSSYDPGNGPPGEGPHARGSGPHGDEGKVPARGRMARWFGPQSKLGRAGSFIGSMYATDAIETVSAGTTEGVTQTGGKGRWFGPGSRLRAGAKFVGRGIIGYAGGMIVNSILNLLPDFAGKDAIESMINWSSVGLSIFAPQLLSGIMARFGTVLKAGFTRVGGMFTRAATVAATEAAAAEGGAALVGAAGAGGMGLTAVIGMALPEVAAIVIAAILAKEGLSSFGQWFTQWWSGRNNQEEAAHNAKLQKAYDKLAEEEKNKTMTPAEHRRRWQELKDQALKDETTKKDKPADKPEDTVDQVAVMYKMLPQLSGMLNPDDPSQRYDPLRNADMRDTFAGAIKDVQADTAAFLTQPFSAQTDSFEDLNRRLLDTMAVIAIDQQKQVNGPDAKLDLEIKRAQLEQMQIQTALLHRGNVQRENNRQVPQLK